MSRAGGLTLNGISDEDLREILGVKIKYDKTVYFNPQQIQPVTVQGGGQIYNNVSLNWNSDDGLEAVYKVISILLKKEEHLERAAVDA